MEKPEIAGYSSMKLEMEPGTYWWCSCGKSKNQPFCDGSHKGSSFSPVETTIEHTKICGWCTCKLSEKKPFCDGTHKSLTPPQEA
jgi:CDGSH-type Zn-finger protein